MTLCDFPSLWRVLMIIFWTIAKSAVFLIIVIIKNKSRDRATSSSVKSSLTDSSF